MSENIVTVLLSAFLLILIMNACFDRYEIILAHERQIKGAATSAVLAMEYGMDVHPDIAWVVRPVKSEFDLSFSSDAIYFYGDK